MTTPSVGDLYHLLGRTEACRIVGHEIAAGSNDAPVDWWHVETPEGTLLVESWQITDTWPAEDDLGKYEPPTSRLGVMSGIEVTGDDRRPWDLRERSDNP